jgi:hypothetical protein
MMATKSMAAADVDMDSVSSFGGSPDKELLQTRPKGRYAWVGNEQVCKAAQMPVVMLHLGISFAETALPIAQVNHENFQRMLEEYRAAKNTEKDMSIKIKQ